LDLRIHDVSLPEYSAVVIEGAVDTRDTGLLRSLMDQRIGLVLSGQTPYLLAGESQYLGPISDWFGASFLLKTWGSAVTPAANRIFDSKSDKLADLHGLPEWRYGVWALSPAGLSPRTVVVSWCKDDIAVFSAAARPDATHPGRMYYQGSLGEDRYPQLDSLYVSGIRWAAGLLRKN
jgi:hypothetical protein